MKLKFEKFKTIDELTADNIIEDYNKGKKPLKEIIMEHLNHFEYATIQHIQDAINEENL